MKKEESKGKELAILISQARQLEATAKLATYKSSESLEEQYHRLRDNLVSLDPDANKCLPDFRRKGYAGMHAFSHRRTTSPGIDCFTCLMISSLFLLVFSIFNKLVASS